MDDHEPQVSDGKPSVQVRQPSADTTLLSLIGEHDLSTRAVLDGEISRAWHASRVIFDLSQCTFLDSTIIKGLLGALREGRDVELVLPAPATNVSRILGLMQVDKLVTATYASTAEALRGRETAAVDPSMRPQSE